MSERSTTWTMGHESFATRRVRIADRFKTASWWIRRKREEDNLPKQAKSTASLWRIHDDVYDFAAFADRHPGGRDFFEITRDTDITELFESSHLNIEAVRRILPKYRVKPETPLPKRTSSMTFEADGLYANLRSRANAILGNDTGPTRVMLLLSDALVLLWALLWITSNVYASLTLTVLSGVALASCCGMAHNFFSPKAELASVRVRSLATLLVRMEDLTRVQSSLLSEHHR